MLPDYYEIFGLDQAASKEEIKSRFRELAKKYHPDVNKNDNATAKMQEIVEANYILSDDEARRRYDIQYAKVYGTKWERFEENKQAKEGQTHGNNSTYTSNQFDDPILEKWILNAKRQAVDFLKTTYRDTKGIAASGCLYYFKALGICSIILIVISLLIRIFISLRK